MITRISKALADRRETIKDGDKGFTLIELLVVVIIIGILAAIAIPVYIGVQNSAKDSAAKSDLTNAKNAVVAYYTSNSTFPAVADLSDFGYKLPTDATAPAVTLTGTDLSDFCAAEVSATGTSFKITQDSSPAEGTC